MKSHFKLKVIILIFLLVVSIFSLVQKSFPVQKSGTIFLPNGMGLNFLATKLAQESYIKNKIIFRLTCGTSILLSKKILKFGEYEITKNDNLFTLCNKITNGEVLMHKITIAEGLQTQQIIEILNKDENLVGQEITFNPDDEGMLLPETYYFPKYTKRQQIFAKMKDDMNILLENIWQKRNKEIVIKNKKDLLILASIVEKETSVESERPLIAGLYLNRLQKNMRLQADPTVAYEITQGTYELKRNLTFQDLKINGDYNTYRIMGLPKRPICNPGKASINATANPVESDFLYFVADSKTGGHVFSNDYKQHLVNVEEYRRIKAMPQTSLLAE
jgi:UPF0755 protein